MIREANRTRIGVAVCCLVAICLAGCATTREVDQGAKVCGRGIGIEKVEK